MKLRNRKRLLAAACAAALAVSLSACGSSTESTPHLTWYVNPDGGGADPYGGGQAEIARLCTEQAGGEYTMSVELLPNSASDQRQQLLRRLAGGDAGVDLISMDPPFIPEFAQADFLLPFPEDRWDDFTEDRVESSIDASIWDDELFAAPFHANTQLLWYRKSVAEAAGLDMEDGITWDQLIDAAASEDVAIGVQAMRYEGYAVWINQLISGAGGSIIENESVDVADVELGLDSEAGREAARIIRRVADEGVGGPSMGVSDETVSLNVFENPDTSGFLLQWPYVWGAFTSNDLDFLDDIGWTMYPTIEEGADPTPPLGGTSISIGAFTEHPELAFDAAECATSHEMQLLYFLRTGAPAARAAVFTEPEILEQLPMAPMIRDSLEIAVPRPLTPYYSDLSAAIQRVWSPPGSVNEDTPLESEELVLAVLRGERLL